MFYSCLEDVLLDFFNRRQNGVLFSLKNWPSKHSLMFFTFCSTHALKAFFKVFFSICLSQNSIFLTPKLVDAVDAVEKHTRCTFLEERPRDDCYQHFCASDYNSEKELATCTVWYGVGPVQIRQTLYFCSPSFMYKTLFTL